MRIPELVWDKRHNVAWLQVSFGNRMWDTREVADLILGYNATGRLTRVVLRDPQRMLPPAAGPVDAVRATIRILTDSSVVREWDLEVLHSARRRAEAASAPTSLIRSTA